MNYTDLTNSAKTVLVEFFASWCPHCQRMMPVVAKVKEELGDSAKVYQIDVDEYPEITKENGVESYPTFILYRDGREVWRQSGEMEGSVLLRQVESAL